MSEIELRRVKVTGFSDVTTDGVLNSVQTALEDLLGIAVSRDGEPQAECLFEVEVTVAKKPNG